MRIMFNVARVRIEASKNIFWSNYNGLERPFLLHQIENGFVTF